MSSISFNLEPHLIIFGVSWVISRYILDLIYIWSTQIRQCAGIPVSVMEFLRADSFTIPIASHVELDWIIIGTPLALHWICIGKLLANWLSGLGPLAGIPLPVMEFLCADTYMISIGSLLDLYWIIIGALLGLYWIYIGSPLDLYWIDAYWISIGSLIGSLLDLYWVSIGSLLDL